MSTQAADPAYNRLTESGIWIPETHAVSGNYSAANPSTARGYVYFPELRTKHDLVTEDRQKILTKARWVTRNGGIGKRFRDGIAEMVGSLTPQPKTADSDWNQEALSLFLDLAGAPLIFDAAGEENFWQRQLTLTKLMIQDGDTALALSYTTSGNPSTKLYPATQMLSPRGKTHRDGWFDGVLMQGDRRVAFNLRDEDLREDVVRLDAADAIYFGDPEPGAPRAVSKFAPFVDRMLDVRELDNDEMKGIKAANMVGFYVTNGILQNAQQQAMFQKFVESAQFGQNNAANAPRRPLKMEQITGYKGDMVNMDLGQDIKTVNDSRRHPNRTDFIDYLIRDFAWGTGFPQEVLWFLGRLTGPAVRYMIKSGERAARHYRDILKRRYCQRIWVWFVSAMMNQGRLRRCKDRRYWQCEWLEPESMTIDLGRDIAAGLSEIKAGGNTFQNWYGEVNQDWEKAFEQRGKEIAKAMEIEARLNLPPGSMLGNVNITFAPGGNPPGQSDPQSP